MYVKIISITIKVTLCINLFVQNELSDVAVLGKSFFYVIYFYSCKSLQKKVLDLVDTNSYIGTPGLYKMLICTCNKKLII